MSNENELCLVSASGGLDSSTTLAVLKLAGYENIIACHFDYGARSTDAEKIAITNVCKTLDIPLKIFDISAMMKSIDETSMLMNPNAEITTGTSAGLKKLDAWVNGRNMMFMTIMATFAESLVMKHGYTKVHFLGGFLNLSESGCIPTDTPFKVATMRRDSSDNVVEYPVGSIRVGDRIMGYNEANGKREDTIVREVFETRHDKYCRIKFRLVPDENASLNLGITTSRECSVEHPFYVVPSEKWVRADELTPGDLVEGISPAFNYKVVSVDIIHSPRIMKNFHCEPHNNFFFGKVLTHNSYPDNSEYFLDSCLNMFKYGTLIGDKISPLYCLSNLMKHEQFVLIKAFELYNAYRHTISCDRAFVTKLGVPCNCAVNGLPGCGSGMLSYWASKMVGMDDMKLRIYSEVKDPGYKPHVPNHMLDENFKEPNIHDIIDRILLPQDKLAKLHEVANYFIDRSPDHVK